MGGKRLRAYGVVACVVALGLLANGGGAAARPLPPLPARAGYALLGGGWYHKFLWLTWLHSKEGLPCLEVALGGESLDHCDTPTPTAVTSVTAEPRSGSRSVVAVLAGPRVRRVYLNLLGRPDVVLRLERLKGHDAKVAHVSNRFRTATRLLSGPFCLRRFVAYGVDGERIFRSDIHPCD